MKLLSTCHLSFTLVACLLIAACGQGGPAVIDAAPPDAAPVPPDAKPAPGTEPDAPYQRCGDGLVTGDETCDDGNDSDDDACLSNCTPACGDGVVNELERCDIGIGSGEGACPTACNDSDTCTMDVLAGDNCQSECIYTPITTFVSGDGCCPVGGNANLDSDCAAACGNDVLEPGELCDTGIDRGQPGACPAADDCDDQQMCTTDELVNPGTCNATCRRSDITTPVNGDGCCPPGGDNNTDDDCSANCGNGVRESGETCDTAIPAGSEGACPLTCVDDDTCTTDRLLSAGTCNATCTHTPITEAGPVDGCCPPGGNANMDGDCTPVCGNGERESGETCDDGNTVSGDGCDGQCAIEIVPTAFRLRTLELRDPHAFAEVFFICMDVTDRLNNEFAKALTRDGDDPPDGRLDLNVVQLFRPLAQAASDTPFEFLFADCTTPLESPTCSLPEDAVVPPVLTRASNLAEGTCIAPTPGTVRPYSPGVTSATGPCYASAPETIVLRVKGIEITLTNAQVGASYVGNPASRLINGMVKGFISQADAEMAILPDDLPVVGGQPLSSILRGGAGNCKSGSDMDMGPGGIRGWWIYFNFTADVVSWAEQ